MDHLHSAWHLALHPSLILAFFKVLNINDRTAYLAKVLGTIIGILLLVMLLCSILVGFSQFGFACIANPEDLIELEVSTLGEFGKFEEDSELKVGTCKGF
jgi:hypothetical protein